MDCDISDIGPLYDKKINLLTSDKLDMCTILPEQFNCVFTKPLPNKQVTVSEFSFLLNQLHLRMMKILTNIIITESIIIDSIKELSLNSAAFQMEFLLPYC